MTSTAVKGERTASNDSEPIRCILEMDSDGQVAVIVSPGCSVEDVYDMLRLLVDCGGHFDHLTFVTEEEN